MAVGFVASATSGSQASVASFSIGTLGTGARGGIVFVCTHNSATPVDTGVTWNGTAMTLLYSATDTDTEPGVVRAYFLDNVTNGTISVTRTNNATVCVGYAASISALRVTRAYQTITRVSSTQNTDANTSTTGTGASGEVAVDDGSPGTSSMRFAASYTGAATPVANGTNSSALQSLDSTALGSSFVRETTAGQGSRNVGFATGTTDDWALVAVAVREEPALTPQPTAAALTLTGDTPAVATPILSQPTAAGQTLAGSTPTVTTTSNTTSLPTAASLAFSGATPTVTVTDNITPQPTAAAMTATGATPTVALPVVAAPTAGAVIFTGSTPTVSATANVTAEPTAASLATSTGTPTVSLPIVSLPTAPAMAVTGSTPTVVATDNITAAPTAGTLSLAGDTPTVTVSSASSIQPSAAAMSTSLATPTVAAAQTYAPTAASMTASGATPAVTAPQAYVPTVASMAASMGTPTVSVQSGDAVVPDAAAMALTGATPTIVVGDNIVITPDTLLVSLAGFIPDVSAAFSVEPAPAFMVLEGVDFSVVTARPFPQDATVTIGFADGTTATVGLVPITQAEVTIR